MCIGLIIRVVASTQSFKYQYKYQYLSLKYQYQYQYPCLKYKYKYQYFGSKCQYQYKYLKMVLKYRSSTSTSTQYYNPADRRTNTVPFHRPCFGAEPLMRYTLSLC